MKGLYIHIPFCEQICHYCDFVKYQASPKHHVEYIKSLLDEISSYKDEYYDVTTVYIGGGTPSHIHPRLLEQLFQHLQKYIDLSSLKEFSIESNPSDITDDWIQLLQKYHVSRLSIGVQSFSNALLALVGRNHQLEDVLHAVDVLEKNHFLNYNLDMIYAIPSQTINDVLYDLSMIERLRPNHVSYYSLILEEKTRLFHQINQRELSLVEEDVELEMAEMIEERLFQMGYEQYEFSNYALKGNQSIHNLLYWNLSDYLGLGLGASSFLRGTRFKNHTTLKKYDESVKKTGKGLDVIEPCDLEYEFILMGLRKIKGIDILEFKRRFDKDIFQTFPCIHKYITLGYLVQAGNDLFFSREGRFLSNQFFMELR